MHNIDRKAEILRAIAAGKALNSVANDAGISTGQAFDDLSRICRALNLPYNLSEIRSNPLYLNKLDELLINPTNGLRPQLVQRLVHELKIHTNSALTPAYVSNLTASDLYRNGITVNAIAEIQEWLQGYDLSLRKAAPESDKEIREVRRAISFLNAFF